MEIEENNVNDEVFGESKNGVVINHSLQDPMGDKDFTNSQTQINPNANSMYKTREIEKIEGKHAYDK